MRIRFFPVVVMLCCFVAVSFAFAPAGWAQGPRQSTCGEADGSVKDCFDDMFIQQEGMISNVSGIVDDMETLNIFSLIAGQAGEDIKDDLRARLGELEEERERSKAENGEATDKEYDEMLTKGDKSGEKKKCKFSDMPFYETLLDANDTFTELPGYVDVPTGAGAKKLGNGKCDIFKAKDADTDQEVQVNERKEGMCEQVCEEKANKVGKTKRRLQDRMVVAIDQTYYANQMLAAQRQALRSVFSEIQRTRANYPSSLIGSADVCAPGGPGADLWIEEGFNIALLIMEPVVGILSTVSETTTTVYEVSDGPCKQTVAGFNAATACVVPKTVERVSKVIVEIAKAIKDFTAASRDLSSTTAKIFQAYFDVDANACTKEIRDEFKPGGAIVILQQDVDDLQVKAGQTADALDDIQDELAVLKSILEENRDLLQTPAGRRAGFPAK
jgi:hypothetical protein